MNNIIGEELTSESSGNQCSPLSMVMAEERPITVDEACALRLLLFGNLKASFNESWTKQSFHFRRIPSYGILQKKAGPCGVLAAVQAFVIRHLIFGRNVDISKLNLKVSEKREALAHALATIVWQAGEYNRSFVAIKHDSVVLESAIASGILHPDGLLEYVQLKNFECRACLFEYFLNFVPTMMSDDTSSCVLFLYSVIFSHGIQRIKEEMDFPESHLIGRDGYCSQEVINLMLVGKAVANLFDGEVELNSGGSETSLHHGIPTKSKIGLLSLYEYHETCTVGDNYKNPILPIWLLHGESHFTVLFSSTTGILKEERSRQLYTLYHYDGLALRHAETLISIDPYYHDSPPSKDSTKPVYLRCIYTRWPRASIQVKEDSGSSSSDFKTIDIPVIEGDGGTITTAVEDGVLILTHDNFDLQVSSKETMLVEFYAPWCGHCKALEPEFAKAAKILRKGDKPIYLAKVDATLETDLASRFGVTGYPTLYIFKKGEKVLYDGPRSAMGIVEYMKERADPNWKPPPEAVITLTKENFTDVVDNEEIILVEFYAPWCGHCKRLAPEYERAAKVLKDLPKPIPLAKVDGIAEKELAETYDTQGWPTLLVFRKGRKYSYEGPRDETGIISYMKEQAKPPSKEFGTLKTFKAVVSKSDAAVVGFFDSASGLYEHFIEAAHSLRGKFVFMHSFKKDVRKSFDVDGVKIIVFLPEIYTTKYEPKKFVMDNAEATSKDITAFIQEHSIPLVGERNYQTRWLYEKAYPLVVVYYDVDFSFDHRVQTQLVQKEVAKVAKDYKGKITFAISNENEHQDELQQLNLDDSGEDVNVGYYHSEKIRYRMEPTEDFSEEELRSFVEDVVAGNIPRHIKSQPAPKVNGPVYTIVGSTFDDLVLKSEKDVLIEFYAPWCGHCKKLEPIYKKLGKAFENNDQVLIAKIDATANDFPPEYQVSGFPTIYYLPSADKTKLITFSGERTLKELTKFVNEQLAKRSSKDEL